MNISRVSSASNLLSVPMKDNKFISNTSSVSNLTVNHLSVSRHKGYQVYQEESSVTRSIRYIKVYQRVSWFIKYIKCISVTRTFVIFYILYMSVRLCFFFFFHFCKQQMCMLWTLFCLFCNCFFFYPIFYYIYIYFFYWNLDYKLGQILIYITKLRGSI